jgi:hypothetical protein
MSHVVTQPEATSHETDVEIPQDPSSSSQGSPTISTEREVPPLPRKGTVVSGLRRRILHITPACFSIVMGTGIASILFHNNA